MHEKLLWLTGARDFLLTSSARVRNCPDWFCHHRDGLGITPNFQALSTCGNRARAHLFVEGLERGVGPALVEAPPRVLAGAGHSALQQTAQVRRDAQSLGDCGSFWRLAQRARAAGRPASSFSAIGCGLLGVSVP